MLLILHELICVFCIERTHLFLGWAKLLLMLPRKLLALQLSCFFMPAKDFTQFGTRRENLLKVWPEAQNFESHDTIKSRLVSAFYRLILTVWRSDYKDPKHSNVPGPFSRIALPNFPHHCKSPLHWSFSACVNWRSCCGPCIEEKAQRIENINPIVIIGTNTDFRVFQSFRTAVEAIFKDYFSYEEDSPHVNLSRHTYMFDLIELGIVCVNSVNQIVEAWISSRTFALIKRKMGSSCTTAKFSWCFELCFKLIWVKDTVCSWYTASWWMGYIFSWCSS